MTSGFRHTQVGEVEISNHDLTAVCQRCDARIRYGLGMRLGAWKALLKDFIHEHRHCEVKRRAMQAGGGVNVS